MNQLPKFIHDIACNDKGQIITDQRSLFSFFHEGLSFVVHLTRAYHKGINMGSNLGYNVRVTCFIGLLPLTIHGGIEHRSKVLSLIYRSNYNDGTKFYVNYRQMILGTSYVNIKQADALDANKLMSSVVVGYHNLFPFIDLLSNYVDPPGKISKRYAMTR